jgi:hypothetical protein
MSLDRNSSVPLPKYQRKSQLVVQYLGLRNYTPTFLSVLDWQGFNNAAVRSSLRLIKSSMP